MKSALLFLTALLFCLSSAFSQTEPANYAKVLNTFKLFYNENKPDSIYKIVGPEMRKDLTEEKFHGMVVQLKEQLGSFNEATFSHLVNAVATYHANFEKGSLTLQLSLNKANQMIGFLLQPIETPAAALTNNDVLSESAFNYKMPWGNIAGTITMPKSVTGEIPVVLIIAGSGPVDRNGNEPPTLNTNSYLLLAAALAKNGIATLRYDKRGVDKSITTTKESDMLFEDGSDDAIALIKTLHDDARFSKIIVAGHSEGSLVGMLASYDQPVSAFVSLEGPGSPIDQIIMEQLKSKPPYIVNGVKAVLDSLRKGKFVAKVDPALYSIVRPSVQPYMLSWMNHDPVKEIKKLKIPVLIVQGTTDLQVGVDEAVKLKKAKSNAELVMIPNMNHVLKEAPVDNTANLTTYINPNLPIKPELVTAITAFINKLK